MESAKGLLHLLPFLPSLRYAQSKVSKPTGRAEKLDSRHRLAAHGVNPSSNSWTILNAAIQASPAIATGIERSPFPWYPPHVEPSVPGAIPMAYSGCTGTLKVVPRRSRLDLCRL
jgi:hypothetical protein